MTIHGPATTGSCVYFAESIDKVANNLKEVRPTLFFGVPRIWEKLYAGIIDLILVDKYVVRHFIQTKYPQYENAVEWIDPPLKIDPQYLIFSKNAKNYQTKMDAFNQGLAVITENGAMQRIMESHGFRFQK